MIIKDAQAFGQALRERRKELNLTQRQVAEASGVSLMFISELERGKPTAQLGKALGVADLLGLTISFTVRGKQCNIISLEEYQAKEPPSPKL